MTDGNASMARSYPGTAEPCPYCSDGKRTGLPGNACENCMNTGLKYPGSDSLPPPEYITGLVVRLRNTDLIDDFARLDAADLIERLRTPAQTEMKWRDGAPSRPWSQECFIAETTYGDKVVLKALPDEWTYDFKTADETYIRADKIKRWMQFPDSSYISPGAPSVSSTARATPSCDCGFAADVCATNHCHRKQIASAGLSPVPAGYSKLPDGAVCKCPKMWRATDGSRWCCTPSALTSTDGASR